MIFLILTTSLLENVSILLEEIRPLSAQEFKEESSFRLHYVHLTEHATLLSLNIKVSSGLQNNKEEPHSHMSGSNLLLTRH